MSRLELRVVALERKLLEVECDEVTLPAGAGYICVLPGHAPLLTMLRPGELHYRAGREEGYAAIAGGFCEVSDDVVTVLADRAELPEEIDADAARQAAHEAEEELHRTLDQTYEEILDRLEQAQAWLQVAGRR